MTVRARASDGPVSVEVSNHGLSRGFDIVELHVNGQSIIPLREGEFATKEEAIAAGLKRGHAAIKADNIPLGKV
ncbi:Uncharacterized protein ALO79_05297 [Pseudomonas syringae pv. castaneae]|uniref:Uncharacterized protein n=1 Tax=Pseudomonas syringae pv. castaneae TaxID=264450 RepID=A0A0P9NRL0_PSESX|nr:Uncharacterized protein ALO79_05297 [Pseudomonas syringae pv. castaneae]KWS92147.1 hypothetical protein AL048_27975 [Pseudomonas syringae pv. castaneae]